MTTKGIVNRQWKQKINIENEIEIEKARQKQ